MTSALSVSGVNIELGRPRRPILQNVALEVRKSSIHALIGESGSGKSTLARVVVGLASPSAGTVRFDGVAVDPSHRFDPQRAQLVFQEPAASLDPRYTARQSIVEGIRADRTVWPSRGARSDSAVHERVDELCDLVALSPALLDRYPHQLSGGQCQRVAIARAIAPRPRVLVADEITASLDVTVQAQIVELVARLVDRIELSALFITHDLELARRLADDVTVLRNGCVVERGLTTFSEPKDPYTRSLVDSILWISDETVRGSSASGPAVSR